MSAFHTSEMTAFNCSAEEAWQYYRKDVGITIHQHLLSTIFKHISPGDPAAKSILTCCSTWKDEYLKQHTSNPLIKIGDTVKLLDPPKSKYLCYWYVTDSLLEGRVLEIKTDVLRDKDGLLAVGLPTRYVGSHEVTLFMGFSLGVCFRKPYIVLSTSKGLCVKRITHEHYRIGIVLDGETRIRPYITDISVSNFTEDLQKNPNNDTSLVRFDMEHEAAEWITKLKSIKTGDTVRTTSGKNVVVKNAFWNQEHCDSIPEWLVSRHERKPYTFITTKGETYSLVSDITKIMNLKERPICQVNHGTDFVKKGFFVVPKVPGFPLCEVISTHGSSYEVELLSNRVPRKRWTFTPDFPAVSVFKSLLEAGKYRKEKATNHNMLWDNIQAGDTVMNMIDKNQPELSTQKYWTVITVTKGENNRDLNDKANINNYQSLSSFDTEYDIKVDSSIDNQVDSAIDLSTYIKENEKKVWISDKISLSWSQVCDIVKSEPKSSMEIQIKYSKYIANEKSSLDFKLRKSKKRIRCDSIEKIIDGGFVTEGTFYDLESVTFVSTKECTYIAPDYKRKRIQELYS